MESVLSGRIISVNGSMEFLEEGTWKTSWESRRKSEFFL